MRAITGKYKGKHFPLPKNFKARPTTDFAKENLFNVLRAYLDFDQICALDLFAGTGSISLELLSRGCPKVICVEQNRAHFAFLRQMFASLHDTAILPICGDALRYLDKAPAQFDFIFADPPYALKELAEIPDRLFRTSILRENGLFVLEHGKDHDFSAHPNFVEHRAYGSVNFSFFMTNKSNS